MADFTFDNDAKNGGVGATVGGNNGEKPGGHSEASGVANGNSGIEGNNRGNESGQASAADAGAEFPPKKRRGRKPYPRDEFGNIIRPATGAGSNKGRQERLAVKNDRPKVRQNIAGLHAMAAVLTKQPILALNEQEADALTNAVCDVADYHEIDLLTAGGAFGLYAALATTAYMIYVPRIVAIKFNRAAEAAKPMGPGEAGARAKARAHTMDFSADTAH